jgi:hypothetical protein
MHFNNMFSEKLTFLFHVFLKKIPSVQAFVVLVFQIYTLSLKGDVRYSIVALSVILEHTPK